MRKLLRLRPRGRCELLALAALILVNGIGCGRSASVPIVPVDNQAFKIFESAGTAAHRKMGIARYPRPNTEVVLLGVGSEHCRRATMIANGEIFVYQRFRLPRDSNSSPHFAERITGFVKSGKPDLRNVAGSPQLSYGDLAGVACWHNSAQPLDVRFFKASRSWSSLSVLSNNVENASWIIFEPAPIYQSDRYSGGRWLGSFALWDESVAKASLRLLDRSGDLIETVAETAHPFVFTP